MLQFIKKLPEQSSTTIPEVCHGQKAAIIVICVRQIIWHPESILSISISCGDVNTPARKNHKMSKKFISHFAASGYVKAILYLNTLIVGFHRCLTDEI